MRVDDAHALQTTFERIRQRYALHFNLGQGVRPGQESIEVELSAAARRRYPGAEVAFRRVSMSGDAVTGGSDAPMVASTVPVPEDAPEPEDEEPRFRRRPAVNDRSGGPGPRIGTRDDAPDAPQDKKGGWRKADEPEPAVATDKAEPEKADPPPAKSGGWRKLKPGEQP
jgi:hypothetical protein